MLWLISDLEPNWILLGANGIILTLTKNLLDLCRIDVKESTNLWMNQEDLILLCA